jgi:hypothetical protein
MFSNGLYQLGKYLLGNWKNLFFNLICWYFGIKIFSIGYTNINLTRPYEIPPIFLVLSGIGILLILLPFFKRVKVGELEIEREIEQTKNELSEFKNETRNTLTVVSTQISAVASIKNQNQITVYVPGYDGAKADLKEQIPETVEKEAEEIKDELIIENQDNIMALVKLRIQLEYLLRKLLEKRLNVTDASKEIKYMSLMKLTREFLHLYPDFLYLTRSFDYVRDVGNAAVHGQQVPDFQARETFEIGGTLIATLKNIALNDGIIVNCP